MLGGRAGSAELRTWASRELNGYGPGDELPEWRVAAAAIRIDFTNVRAKVTGRQISPMMLPEFAHDKVKEEFEFRMGVGAMEALVDGTDGEIKFGIPGGQELLMLWNYQNQESFQDIHAIYWSVSKVAVRAILDRIRNSLTELVAEIRAGMPSDADVPSAELATQAVEIAVHGRGNRVIVNNAQVTQGDNVARAPDQEGVSWKRWAKIGAFVVGLATIIGVLVQLFGD